MSGVFAIRVPAFANFVEAVYDTPLNRAFYALLERLIRPFAVRLHGIIMQEAVRLWPT